MVTKNENGVMVSFAELLFVGIHTYMTIHICLCLGKQNVMILQKTKRVSDDDCFSRNNDGSKRIPRISNLQFFPKILLKAPKILDPKCNAACER
jgi:hypothetical protein